jgi:ABC-type sulfate transport system permease subunit
VASLLTLLAIVTLVLKAVVEWRSREEVTAMAREPRGKDGHRDP